MLHTIHLSRTFSVEGNLESVDIAVFDIMGAESIMAMSSVFAGKRSLVIINESV